MKHYFDKHASFFVGVASGLLAFLVYRSTGGNLALTLIVAIVCYAGAQL